MSPNKIFPAYQFVIDSSIFESVIWSETRSRSNSLSFVDILNFCNTFENCLKLIADAFSNYDFFSFSSEFLIYDSSKIFMLRSRGLSL
jgi:hypothetical protein